MKAASAELDEGMTGEKAASILSAIYEKALNGVPKVIRSIDEFADDYADRFDTPERAAKELVKYQIIKVVPSGLLRALRAHHPARRHPGKHRAASSTSRCAAVAVVAKIGGYDVRSDQVQTLVYVCLTGTAISDVVKQAGIKIGEKTLTAALKKLTARHRAAVRSTSASDSVSSTSSARRASSTSTR